MPINGILWIFPRKLKPQDQNRKKVIKHRLCSYCTRQTQYVLNIALKQLTEFIKEIDPLKLGTLSFKLSVLKKTHIWTPFNVYIYLDDALLFQNKKNKILFAPPPQKKEAQGYELSRYVYTQKCFSIQSARDLDIH